jgi:autotransporter-associated beta strand protein
MEKQMYKIGITFLSCCGVLITGQMLHAASATWNLNPINSDWNTAANWTPATVPNGPDDIATFDVSNTTSILSGNVEVNGIVFNPGASPFTITTADPFAISGSGVTNNSGITQKFVVGLSFFPGDNILTFSNSATAGSNIKYTAAGSSQQAVDGGEIHFLGNSSAGFATFQIRGGSDNGTAALFFNDFSTAGNATIVNYGGGHGSAQGGFVDFLNPTPTAGDASISTLGGTASGAHGAFTAIANGGNATIATYGGSAAGAEGGSTLLKYSAENATFTIYGGTNGGEGAYVFFSSGASAQNARFEIFGNGLLDLSNGGPPTPAVGSIEGDGLILLPYGELTVGSNGLTTTFAGNLQSPTPNFGSVVKVGSGKLTLSGANTYSGGTTVSEGSLVVTNTTGSGTGSRPVQVNGGTLAGNGTIAGSVAIGTGSGTGAVLAPSVGVSQVAVLTLQRALTFNADGTYIYKLNTRNARADQVIANGVTIESGAQFNFQTVANKRVANGTVFTAISNTSANPIAGIFANLPDGSTFTAGRNNFQVSYSGGDGNDLTLTVVP